MARERIDRVLVDRQLVPSRARGHALLLAGKVFVNGQRVDKAGALVSLDATIEVKQDDCPFVSRGGLKLDGVLEPLGVNPSGRVCLDVGASTGGFTDVLLQRGAIRVYAIDVGRGQLHERLRQDPRVISHESVNARTGMTHLVTEPVSLVVMDVSFISLTLVLPAVIPLLARGARTPSEESCIVAMVKPQFELSASLVGRGGVVRDDVLRAAAVDKVVTAARTLGLALKGQMDAPIAGPAGNREIFVRLDPTSG